MTIEITQEAIEAVLREELSPSQLTVIDESGQHIGHVGSNDTGQGTHFRVQISSPAFKGKSKVQQHRMVYAALESFFVHGLHALAIESSVG